MGKFHLCLCHAEVHIRGARRREKKRGRGCLKKSRGDLLPSHSKPEGLAAVYLHLLILCLWLMGYQAAVLKGTHMPEKVPESSGTLFPWIINPQRRHQSSILYDQQPPSILPTMSTGYSKHFWKEKGKQRLKKKLERILKHFIRARLSEAQLSKRTLAWESGDLGSTQL